MSTIAVPVPSVRFASVSSVVPGAMAAATCIGSAVVAAAVGTGLTALAVASMGAAAGWVVAAVVYTVASGVVAGGVGRSGGGSGRRDEGTGWQGRLARRVVGSRWSYVAAAVCGPVTLAAAVSVGGGRRVPLSVITGWAVAFGLVEAGWQTLVVTGLL